MLIRIVKMTFQEDKIEEFLEIFNASCHKIKASDGCLHLELLRGYRHENVMTTYSCWENEAKLDAYRESELFKTTWAKTKPLFSEKPQAFSLQKLIEL